VRTQRPAVSVATAKLSARIDDLVGDRGSVASRWHCRITQQAIGRGSHAIGISIRLFWLHAPYPVVAAVYVVAGWMALVDLPAYLDALTGGEVALVVIGGLLYTAGAVVYALHKPNPWPSTFGYHEIFHALVVVAALAQYLAVFSLAG
jgi:hemolysin III